MEKNINIEKIIDEEIPQEANYTLVSYYDEGSKAWSIPTAIEGTSEEALDIFKTKLKRACMSNSVDARNDGLVAYKVGVFNDWTGKIESCEPVFLGELKNANSKREA